MSSQDKVKDILIQPIRKEISGMKSNGYGSATCHLVNGWIDK